VYIQGHRAHSQGKIFHSKYSVLSRSCSDEYPDKQSTEDPSKEAPAKNAFCSQAAEHFLRRFKSVDDRRSPVNMTRWQQSPHRRSRERLKVTNILVTELWSTDNHSKSVNLPNIFKKLAKQSKRMQSSGHSRRASVPQFHIPSASVSNSFSLKRYCACDVV